MKWTQGDLAKRINVGTSTISMWEGGERSPDIDTLYKLASIFDVSLSALLGEEIKQDDVNLSDAYAIKEFQKIPILGEVRAGYNLLAKENIQGYTFISKKGLPEGEYFALKVNGDSMINAGIKEGYTVIVKKQPFVDEGQIAVVLINDEEATLKRVFYEGEEYVNLVSENHTYRPTLHKYEDVKILGKVVRVEFEL